MMNLVRCPRCELNFMLKGEKCCKICQQEVSGEHVNDDVELCSVCGQAPALPGRDICLDCLKEMEDDAESRKETGADALEPEEGSVEDAAQADLDEAVTAELGQLGNELSLEDMAEDEDREDDSDKEPDEC